VLVGMADVDDAEAATRAKTVAKEMRIVWGCGMRSNWGEGGKTSCFYMLKDRCSSWPRLCISGWTYPSSINRNPWSLRSEWVLKFSGYLAWHMPCHLNQAKQFQALNLLASAAEDLVWETMSQLWHGSTIHGVWFRHPIESSRSVLKCSLLVYIEIKQGPHDWHYPVWLGWTIAIGPLPCFCQIMSVRRIGCSCNHCMNCPCKHD
jgi:hypothetical protein